MSRYHHSDPEPLEKTSDGSFPRPLSCTLNPNALSWNYTDTLDSNETPILAQEHDTKSVRECMSAPDGVFQNWSPLSPKSLWVTPNKDLMRSQKTNQKVEEEEREEEALPSYLSYLQPPIKYVSSSTSGSSACSFGAADATFTLPQNKVVASVPPHSGALESQLVSALHNYVTAQMEMYIDQSASLACVRKPISVKSSQLNHCDKCLQYESQINELQRTIQERCNTVESVPFTSDLQNRIATVEGRQSAFQSQLAQICKLFGLNLTKNGSKVAQKQFKTHIQNIVNETLHHTNSGPPSAPAPTNLDSPTPQFLSSNQTVLTALAREHESALAKLKLHMKTLVTHEATARAAIEQRFETRTHQLEEWLHQMEGELRFHPKDPLISVQNELTQLQSKVKIVESDCQNLKLKCGGKVEKFSNQETVGSLKQLIKTCQAQCLQQFQEQRANLMQVRDDVALVEFRLDKNGSKIESVERNTNVLKQFVERMLREVNSVDGSVHKNVCTITHQVASVTRKYVSLQLSEHYQKIFNMLQECGSCDLDKMMVWKEKLTTTVAE